MFSFDKRAHIPRHRSISYNQEECQLNWKDAAAGITPGPLHDSDTLRLTTIAHFLDSRDYLHPHITGAIALNIHQYVSNVLQNWTLRQ